MFLPYKTQLLDNFLNQLSGSSTMVQYMTHFETLTFSYIHEDPYLTAISFINGSLVLSLKFH